MLEDPNGLRSFYDPIKKKHGPNFTNFELPGCYGLGFGDHEKNQHGDDIELELSFPTADLTERRVCVVSLWYNFPTPCRDPNKLIQGLQKAEKIASDLRSKGYESDFEILTSYTGCVLYQLRKYIASREDAERVFQEVSPLESLLGGQAST